MKYSIGSIAIVVLALVLGCGSSGQKSVSKSFDVVLRATSDDGQHVEGAQFSRGRVPIGRTNGDGELKTRIQGSDGESLLVTTQCPDGYVAPEQPTALRLAEVRKLDPSAPSTIQLDVTCTRKTRDVVLVVRANPSLPVEVSGKTVGKTDASGLAHFHFKLDRLAHKLSVSLDTAEAPRLRPRNPSRVFELDESDSVLLFDQSFAAEAPIPVRRRVAKTTPPPAKHIPYRIDSGRSHAF